MPTIKTIKDVRRATGFREPGGWYLSSNGPGITCGKLPLELSACKTCGHAHKPSRGWTWIEPAILFRDAECDQSDCDLCPLQTITNLRAGLLWIAHGFYPSPAAFMREANQLGIVLRIPRPPLQFHLGFTLVFLAHPTAVKIGNLIEPFRQGIFTAFVPTALEYVIRADERKHELDWIEDLGYSVITTERFGENMKLV